MLSTKDIIPRDPVTGEVDDPHAAPEAPTYQRRDYYWKRTGWLWAIWTEHAGLHYDLGLRFLRRRSAARVCNAIFSAYHDGRDAERQSRDLWMFGDPFDEYVRLKAEHDKWRTVLEKIAGRRNYDPGDGDKATAYKRDEGMWTVDEYLADAALSEYEG